MHFLDIIIVLMLFITAYPAVILLFSRRKRKNSWEALHPKISLYLAIFLIFGNITILYGTLVEPVLLITTKQKISINKFSRNEDGTPPWRWQNPIKIIFISDIQAGGYPTKNYLEKMVDRILELRPDLVLLGGDQVDNDGTYENQTADLSSLEKIAKIIPTYAVQGNHEYGIGSGNPQTDPAKRTGDVSKETQTALEKIGIKYLNNKLEKLIINGNEFYLFGGDELWADKLNLETLKNRKDNIPTIALIHNPTAIFEIKKYNVDLMLSGHTHGGQIRLPFVGPVGRVDDILPTELYEGYHNFEGQKIFVTRGIGESGTKARLFCPPEIVLLTIK